MRRIGCTVIVSVLLFAACKENKKGNESPAKNTVALSARPNDQFRENVLKHLSFAGDTAKRFDSILNLLDAQGVSFPQYTSHAYYELSDSVDKIIEHRFADGMTNGDKKAFDAHHELLAAAIGRYDSSMGLSRQQVAFAEWMFVVYDPVKSFCNAYRHPQEQEQSGISDTSITR